MLRDGFLKTISKKPSRSLVINLHLGQIYYANLLGKITHSYPNKSKHLLEFPLRYDGRYRLSKTSVDSINNISSIGVTKVLLLQESDSTFVPIIMKMYVDSSYLATHPNAFVENNFTHKASDFTGRVMFYNWNENFLGGNVFENGKITKKISPNTLQKSYQVCIETWEQTWISCDLDPLGGVPWGCGQIGDMMLSLTLKDRYCYTVNSGNGTGNNGYDPYGNGGGGWCNDCTSGDPNGSNGTSTVDLSPYVLDIIREPSFYNDSKADCVFDKLNAVDAFRKLIAGYDNNGIDHNLMADTEEYLNNMAQILQAADGPSSWWNVDYFKALAWSGLYETKAWRKKSEVEQKHIIDLHQIVINQNNYHCE